MNNTQFNCKEISAFYENKRVLLTGHTGFKGTWLSKILLNAGASVCGYSLQPPTDPSLFDLIHISEHSRFSHIIGDIRDLNKLKSVFSDFHPDIVFHLAAQPLVRSSYQNPVATYEINVIGTVNVLECIRQSKLGRELNCGDWNGVQSFLNVTTDKVYKNNEWCYGYRENDVLKGFDPYSNSKSCSELVTYSYLNSFFNGTNNMVKISTARAGNVFGGGDFAKDRIIPDCIRTVYQAYVCQDTYAEINVRNPYSIRPYQHVLEPLFAYLMIAKAQYENKSFADCYNIGPDECDCIATGELVNLFCEKWNSENNYESFGVKGRIPNIQWVNHSEANAPHEAGYLKLDTSKLKSVFQWKPHWNIETGIELTVKFTKVWIKCMEEKDFGDLIKEMDYEIDLYSRSKIL